MSVMVNAPVSYPSLYMFRLKTSVIKDQASPKISKMCVKKLEAALMPS